jgi:hypothetical protein
VGAFGALQKGTLMTSTHQRAAQMFAAAADLLDLGQLVNRLSVVGTAIGLGVLLIPMVPTSSATQPTAAAVTVLGIVELILAARVALSAAQFHRLADDAAAERLDVAAFDAALMTLKFMRTKKAGQPIPKRFTGARRFLIAQAIMLLLQVIVAIGGGLELFVNPA